MAVAAKNNNNINNINNKGTDIYVKILNKNLILMTAFRLCSYAVVFSIVLFAHCLAASSLSVLEQSSTLSSSRPFVSVNIVDALWNYVGEGPNNATHSHNIMRSACSRGFTIIRFAGTAYWPRNMNDLFYGNETRWYSLFDELVADAKATNCSLIPSFLWNPFLFADIAHEPLSQFIAAPSSVGRSALFRYVESIVSRYRMDPTIVAWELWNELSNMADMNMSKRTSFCAPSFGTPAYRTQQDNFSTSEMISFQALFAATIRRIDTHLNRPITSGNDVPRADAEHLRSSYHTTPRHLGPDTQEEFIKNLIDVNTHCDWVSMHLYSQGGENVRWNYTDPYNAELVLLGKAAADRVQKPFYLGEFGDPLPGPRTFSLNVLSALRQSKASLATVWVWEFYQESSTLPANFSLLPGRDEAFIGAMQDFNRGK